MVASKVTSFKTKGGKTVVVTLQDLGIKPSETNLEERKQITQAIRNDVKNFPEIRQDLTKKSLNRQKKKATGEKQESFAARKARLAPKVEKAAKMIVDEIDKTPQTRPDQKRFNVTLGKASGNEMASYGVEIYGRERQFKPNGEMGVGDNTVMGLMVQNIQFRKSLQGLGLFDAMVKEYQSRYPDRGVFIEQVSNEKWQNKLERPGSGWQKTPDWSEGSRNYWLPPKSR